MATIKKLKPKNTQSDSNVQIEELTDRDHVRRRPGMYLDNIDYCVYEILDNSIDEHMAGYGDTIYIQIDQDGWIRVQDEGRGIPIEKSKKQPTKTQFEVALSSLKAGGKFNQGDSHVKSGGLHGVGAAAVNFTSKVFNATVVRYNESTNTSKCYAISWEQGNIIEAFHEIELDDPNYKHGTYIELLPDAEIWKEQKLNVDAINKRLKQLAYLNPKLSLCVDIDYDGKVINETYHYPNGLIDYVLKLNKNKEQLVDVISLNTSMDHKELGNIEVSIALTYNSGYSEEIFAFTNNIPNPEGGHHLTGFKDGLYKAIKDYYVDNTKGKLIDLIAADVREGLTAIISIKMIDPNFIGQGKTKLDAPKLRSIIKDLTEESINDYLDKNPDKAKLIMAKAIQAQNTRESVRRAREATRSVKNLFSGTPLKLKTCKSNNPDECEIYFVEGDSAGGTAKEARDKNIQAILPVFGKINNTDSMNIKQLLDSVKIKDIVLGLGCSIGEDFDIEKLKYHKIIIMSDADDDGLHIQTLYLTFFYRHLRPLIENGYVYIACPPLFKIIKDKKTYKYCYSVKEKDKLLKDKEWKNAIVNRYKGLGEMSAKELWESTMNPETRVLLQATLENNPEYDEEIITACMGDDVSLRKQLILDDEEITLI